MSDDVWDYDYRQRISAPLFRVTIEVFFFSLIAMAFGFMVVLLMPPFSVDEAWYYSFVYLLLQLLVDAVIIYALDMAYFMLFGVNASAFIGLIVFVNVFFMIQSSLFYRMQNIFTTYTQVELNNNVTIVHPKKRSPKTTEKEAPKQLGEYEYVAK